MSLNIEQKNRLKEIPGIDLIIESIKKNEQYMDIPDVLIVKAARDVVDKLRKSILSFEIDLSKKINQDDLIKDVTLTIDEFITPNLRKIINATGVIVHTNLGRSLLAEEVAKFVYERSISYSNLELDIKTGKRGLRYSLIEELVCEISGSESAMVVNNNAAAVLLCLDTFASNKEVVVSRGELVEIGGSFRIPDVMEKSGAILKEIGTTNRTHSKDYEKAFDEEKTAMFLKVHRSNFDIIGFTSDVSLSDLKKLADEKNIILMDDLGSGTFVDFSEFGLPKEPTVQESLKAGTDLVTFSGDKLLGGPQAGIIAGRKDLIEKIRKNPLTRALRIDKMTLAALEKTLRIYLDPKSVLKKIPTLKMLSISLNEIKNNAEILKNKIDNLKIEGLETFIFESSSRAGGGSLPGTDIPTICVGLKMKNISSSLIEKRMRFSSPSIMGRIEDDIFIMDPRTIQDQEADIIVSSLKKILGSDMNGSF